MLKDSIADFGKNFNEDSAALHVNVTEKLDLLLQFLVEYIVVQDSMRRK